jgi:hypothetical protein
LNSRDVDRVRAMIRPVKGGVGRRAPKEKMRGRSLMYVSLDSWEQI